MEKYDNLGMVGEGSYGMVMKCKHKETGQVVAIKKFLESEDDKMVKKIAMREVRMLRKLRHENLVNLIEVFRRRKRLYLVFEFVDHTVLDDLEKYPNGLNEMTVRKILWQVLRGLEFCHGHNIIHRDIKPENILNSRSGVIKLCDFGFARTLAAPGEVYTDYVATRWYRAPELLVGDTKYGRPVDIWAVGCLITEMLTGDPLFPGDSDIDQLYHIIRCFGNLCPRHREIFQRNPLFAGMRLPDVRDVEPLEKKFPKFSSEVLDLMKQCLRLDPNDRPSSSMLLRHEFFRKDNFEEKVIPELRARILKDAANNMLARKDSNKEQDRERKKKKSKEILSNTGLENQASENSVNINKKSPDQKSMQSNSPKKQDASNSPKKQDTGNSPKKQDASNSPKKQDTGNSPKKQDASNSPKKQDTSNSPKKQDASNSPKKQDTSSPKKENLPKSILKTSSGPNTPGTEVKLQRKGSEKNQEAKPFSDSSIVSKHLPNVESTKQVSIVDVSVNTPRPAFKNLPKDKTNMPQIMKKRSSEDIYSKSIPRDGSIPTNSEKIKTEKSRKSSTKRDLISDLSEPRQPKSSEVRNVKSKNVNLGKISSDTIVSKEKTITQVDREVETSFNVDIMYNSKSVPPPDYKHHRKEAFRKSPKLSESPTRHSIPPIASQISKIPSPDLLGTSPSSSPNLGQSKPIQLMNTPGTKTEKGKKNVLIKKPEASSQQQSSFDRAMYPDKTSHFEKMMMSMSSTTSISHPALKKSHPVPMSQSHMVPINAGITGSSGMQYHRHFRDENKLTNLPLWSTIAIDEKSASLHSSLESSYKSSDSKIHKTSDDYTKPREKSVKQSKKESKYRQSNEEKHRDSKPESQVTRLPDLGRKTSNAQDYSPVNFGILDVVGNKTKKSKNKSLAGVPTLDVANMTPHRRSSRSPSPVNTNPNIDGNFPSVYSKN